ncbi:unnamed protein product [Arctogadus glacialis]
MRNPSPVAWGGHRDYRGDGPELRCARRVAFVSVVRLLWQQQQLQAAIYTVAAVCHITERRAEEGRLEVATASHYHGSLQTLQPSGTEREEKKEAEGIKRAERLFWCSWQPLSLSVFCGEFVCLYFSTTFPSIPRHLAEMLMSSTHVSCSLVMLAAVP